MLAKIYLNLILCTILSQIIGTLAKENVEESLKLHVRQKRVIDLTPGGDLAAIYTEVPYLVNIKKNNELACVGVILSNQYVLIPNSCVDRNRLSEYIIMSGAINLNNGDPHHIMEKFDRIQGHEHRNELALLVMNPSLRFDRTQSRSIRLLEGPIPENRLGLISGWGRNLRPSIIMAGTLRTISVPIMSNYECAIMYEAHFRITDEHICTFDRHRQKRCSREDIGAPLVVFSHLAGVLIFAGDNLGPGYPDVFISVQYPIYNAWIKGHITPRT